MAHGFDYAERDSHKTIWLCRHPVSTAVRNGPLDRGYASSAAFPKEHQADQRHHLKISHRYCASFYFSPSFLLLSLKIRKLPPILSHRKNSHIDAKLQPVHLKYNAIYTNNKVHPMSLVLGWSVSFKLLTEKFSKGWNEC